jgi:NB-ARC domain
VPVSEVDPAITPFNDLQWVRSPKESLDKLEKAKRNSALVQIVKEIAQLSGELISLALSQAEAEPVLRLAAEPVAAVVAPEQALTEFGALFGVPEQRPHYLPREEDLAELRQLLLQRSFQVVGITGHARAVGLHGMGGIGKTVQAIAIANDAAVRRAFPDGIYWVTVGQRPDILSLQRDLARALAADAPNFATDTEAKGRLKALLANKRALVILDDLWHPADAEPFDAVGPHGRLLLTTRDAGLLTALGAREMSLDVLSEHQALALLTEWSGQPREQLPAAARDVAVTCGYLPLALSLAAARVRDGASWQDVLAALRRGDLEFLDHPYGSVFKSLRMSVEALPRPLCERYQELAVFPDDTDVPILVVERLWRNAGLEAYQTQGMLVELKTKGLLYLEGENKAQKVHFHDLQHDFLTLTAGDLTTLHRRLLESYRASTRGGLWHTLLDDGYIHEHLVWHFEKAGWDNEFGNLLREETDDGRCGWYVVRDRLDQTAGFFSDVRRIWSQTHRALKDARGAGDRSKALEVMLRSALILQPGGTVSAGLLPLIVQFGLMSLSGAEARARRLPAGTCAVALGKLAQIDPGGPKRLLAEACKIVESIENDWNRGNSLEGLVPSLEDFVVRAFDLALGLPRDWKCGHILQALAPRLPHVLLDTAENAAKEIADSDNSLLARIGIAVRRIALGRTDADTVPRLLNEIEQTSWNADGNLSKALTLLCPHIPGPLDEQALRILTTITSPVSMASAAATFLRHGKNVPRSSLDFEKWEASTQGWREVYAAFGRDAPYLAEDLKQLLQKYAFLDPPQAGSELSWWYWQPDNVVALARLAPCVQEGKDRDEFVARVLTKTTFADRILSRYDQQRAAVIVALAPHLPEHLLETALKVSSNARNTEHRAEALSALAEKFRDTHYQALRTAVHAAVGDAEYIGDTNERAETLAALIRYLPPQQLSDDDVKECLGAAQDAYLTSRCKLLGALAQHLPKERGRSLLDLTGALSEIAKEDHHFSANEALSALIPGLPNDLLQEAHKLADELASNSDARALAELVPRLQGDARRVAVGKVLLAAPIADGGLEDISGEMLIGVARCLESEQEGRWNELIGDLPDAWRDKALRARRGDREPQEDTREARSELEAAIAQWPDGTRRQILISIRQHAADLNAIGGPAVIYDAVIAICTAARWWP